MRLMLTSCRISLQDILSRSRRAAPRAPAPPAHLACPEHNLPREPAEGSGARRRAGTRPAWRAGAGRPGAPRRATPPPAQPRPRTPPPPYPPSDCGA